MVVGGGHGVQMDRVLDLAVARQRAATAPGPDPRRLVHVPLGYGPAVDGALDGLDPLGQRPVPDLECVAEARGRREETPRLGEDGVAGDEEVARAVLHLDVEVDLERGL